MTRLAAALCLLTLVAAGCGTISNINGSPTLLLPDSTPFAVRERPTPFGGVRRDLRWAAAAIGGTVKDPRSALLIVPVALDVPLSFFGDIVTLPDVLSRNDPAPDRPAAKAGQEPGP